MAKKPIRSFSSGHHSELLYNDELYKNFEATRHLLDRPANGQYPVAKVDGALWLDHRQNELMSYDTDSHKWTPVFDDTLRLIRDISSPTEPEDPVMDQLWICDGVLYYFDGNYWQPVRAGLTTDSQFNIASFGNYVMASPLWVVGDMVVKDKNTDKTVDAIQFLEEREELHERYRQAKIDLPNNSYVIGHTTKTPIYATDDEGHILDGYGKPVKDILDEDGNIVTEGSYREPSIIGFKESPDPWNPRDHVCGITGLEDMPENLIVDKYAQFIAPNINIDRVFLNDRLDHNYEVRSMVHFNYELSKLLDSHRKIKTPSLVHVNPGKLISIRKRIFKVNKVSPFIKVKARYSEFYGFYRFERFGHFMRPVDKNGGGDYTLMSNGIFLTQSGREYDFVVSLTFDYGWIANTGALSITKAEEHVPTYYVGKHAGAANVFINGFNLEDSRFCEDNVNKSVTITGSRACDEITGILYNSAREYGFIREVLPDVRSDNPNEVVSSQGVIRLARNYVQPLVFVNGLLLSASDYTYDAERHLIFVNDADTELPWEVLDAYDHEHDFNTLLATGNAVKDGEIPYTDKESEFAEDDNFVLFVDGLMISHDHIHRDHYKHVFYVDNLRGKDGDIAGQEYVILRDRYKTFFTRQELTPSVGVGDVNQAIVYCNGLYVGDYTQCLTTLGETVVEKRAEDNEIFFFADGQERSKGNTFYCTTSLRGNNWFREELEKYVTQRRKGYKPDLPFDATEIAGKFKIYNQAEGRFETFDDDYAMQLIYMSDNFDILQHNVALTFPYSDADSVYIYAFRYAHDRGKYLTVGTFPLGDLQDPHNAEQKESLCYSLYKTGSDGKWILDEHGEPIPAEGAILIYGKADVETQSIRPVEDNGGGMTFKFKQNGSKTYRYEPNVGALSVWMNGVRMYDITENIDGYSFTIPRPVCGQVQYCIESRKEEGEESIIAQREILDNNNVVPGTINVYRTEKSLFPGAVSVYIDGIRQSRNHFSIIDSNTLMINDNTTDLIGSDGNNYPVETFAGVPDVNGESKWASIDHSRYRYTVREGDPEYPYWCKPHNAGDQNPMPSRILVEVRQEYDRSEKMIDFEERTGGVNDIFVGAEGDFPQIPENILDTSDEVLIFLNGMFFGMAMDDGYTLDKNRLEIRIHNNDFISAVLKDPVRDIMYDEKGNKTIYALDFEEKYGYEYKSKNNIILNWR